MTKAGTRRWRCSECGASSVRKHDKAAKSLETFPRWLLSKDAIAGLKVGRSTFWRKTAWAWRPWPVAPMAGEAHGVVSLDGIRLRREAVALMAVAGGHVVAWHLARTECAAARAARRGLAKLVREGALFAFVETQEGRGGGRPSTSNAVEGESARPREMLGPHGGLSLLHRAKAVFWWCHMDTESPLPAAEILRIMPTGDDVEGLFAGASGKPKREDGAPEECGAGIARSEFHMPTEYRW